jgi:transcriptional regulator with XRE-family HTH domain
MARMASRPKSVTVWYRGIPYLLDLVQCRRALVGCQVEGDLDSMESLANAVGISRSTASRFFSGRPTSLAVTLKILGVLHLKFEQVAKPLDEQDDAEGPTSGGVSAKRSPRGPDLGGFDGTGLRTAATGE